ncbi:GtrA family protein [Sedimentitalea todarodis]|uniref:GtrA family protein n=1 Tax=Sedimentitalea todarodis TaxID=1631240 RepID=A0ABU3VF26_9RHOB|nr:GtrA family protein [Sedimentitalea todarodis]MDU9004319.1 GtrA family protein [Sedimentitalea todarodis]
MQTEFPRFLVVGAINFVFTFLVFTGTLKLLGLPYIAALLISWVLGNILTYVLNFLWVFRPEPTLNFGRRFVKYLTAGTASVAMNVAALTALVELGGYDPFWSQVALIPAIIAVNFSTAKWWSLRRNGVGK